MAKHNLTVRETAQKAGITDFKRFYRWASMGISRATHEHDADLEKIRSLFGLSTLGQFWNESYEEPSSANDDNILSLADLLLSAGKIEREYDAAYKLIVILRSKTQKESDGLYDEIDELFRAATEAELLDDIGQTTKDFGKSPEEILEPRTPERIITFLKINYPDTFETILKVRNSGESTRQWLEQLIRRRGNSTGVLKEVLDMVRKYIDNQAI